MSTTNQPRLPEIHPGTPHNASIRLHVTVLRVTLNAYQVELADNPIGKAWLPRSVVGVHNVVLGMPHYFYVPLWMYRKLREVL